MDYFGETTSRSESYQITVVSVKTKEKKTATIPEFSEGDFFNEDETPAFFVSMWPSKLSLYRHWFRDLWMNGWTDRRKEDTVTVPTYNFFLHMSVMDSWESTRKPMTEEGDRGSHLS